MVRIAPRSWAQVATSLLPNKNRPGRDLKNWGRDTNFHKAARTMSRHQIGVSTPLRPIQVATTKRGRNTVSPAQPQARLRHQNQVATLLETNLCRDINFMSRPRFCPKWDFQVATPKSRSRPPTLLPMSRPQNDVATSNPTGQITTSNFQVATPKGHPTSRPQIHVATLLLPQSEQTRSRHQIHSVLLRRQNPRSPSLRPTATQPGRDATSWSRPHA